MYILLYRRATVIVFLAQALGSRPRGVMVYETITYIYIYIA